MYLAGLRQPSTMQKLQMEVQADWKPDIVESERCGVLFQQTTLLDELTVAGNLALALQKERFASNKERDFRIKQLMDTVGLDYARDASKRPTELSGGMGRRASLALQLAQRKHVIVLDEPFTGLDYDTGVSVAKELVHLRKLGTALILISHEHDLAKIVLAEGTCKGNVTVKLEAPTVKKGGETHHRHWKSSLFGISFRDRFTEKLLDYVFWSLPLILLTFVACGLAISMLSSDTLRRIDVTDQVLTVVDKEVKPMIKLLTGEEPNMMHMIGVRMKVRHMLDSTVPAAKATLYAIGMAKLFVLEIGPLLTALLLTGRIGGSYAGKVATMQATAQNSLLQTLGVNAQMWSLLPALAAAVIAGPVLTAIGTWLSLFLGGYVGPFYGIGTNEDYWREVRSSVFPDLRIRGLVPLQAENSTTTLLDTVWLNADYRTSFSDEYIDTLIEVLTYPPIFHLLKAVTFMLIIMGVAEACARIQTNLTPRGVPSVITSSVVTGGLLIIMADWGFSRLWLKRY